MNTDWHIEDLPYCPQDRALGGIATRLWYAPVDYFGKILLPEVQGYQASRVVGAQGVSLLSDKQLSYIDVFLDKNAFKEKSAGSARNWKLTTELTFSVLELNARNLGFTQAVKNRSLVFFIPDANGRVWLLGNQRNAAYLSNYEASTGEKYEDDNLLSFSFVANTGLYLYQGDLFSIKAVGAFTTGFVTGFRI